MADIWDDQTTNATATPFDLDAANKTISVWGTFDGAKVSVQVATRLNSGTPDAEDWIQVKLIRGTQLYVLPFEVDATNPITVRLVLSNAGDNTSISAVEGTEP